MSSWDKSKGDAGGWVLPEGMDPMRVMQVASAYWQSCALHAANRLDIFNRLDGAKKDLDTLTRETGADRRCLGALLSALVSMDFLDRDGDVFMNNEFSKTFLTTSSKLYQGGIVYMFENWYEAWGGLYDTVTTGKPSALMHQEYSDQETRDYMMGMHNRALSQADVLTGMIDLTGKKQLMDVGCGPATFAVKFCERYAGLNAVAMDREQNLKIARQIVDQYGMQSRVRLVPGDYNQDSLGTGNDAMLLSSMTNQESPENIRKLLKKCHGSMNKGGVILIQEQLLHADKKGPMLAALIGVNQIINTVGGSSYSTAEMEDILRDVGFVDVESRQMAPPSPFIMVTGYKR
ncbi:MAG: O-methyltransferase family protein [Gammaproteobacteria bacterium]|nr:MAG: O-methyltransferase family protein [Gammaproteobacteria bacterium]TND02287.1 MAG: O-methyltransferase family protein [Gammaproteobacteria bacterium]